MVAADRSMNGMPSASTAHIACTARSWPASLTTCGLGVPENGYAQRTSPVVPSRMMRSSSSRRARAASTGSPASCAAVSRSARLTTSPEANRRRIAR